MDTRRVLKLHERELRVDNEPFGMRREAFPNLVRQVDLNGHRGSVIYSHLDAANVDQIIREQIDYFRSIGQAFEWKFFAEDPPADLKDRLLGAGFEAEVEEALMALDLRKVSPDRWPEADCKIRRLTQPSSLGDVKAVQQAAGNKNSDWILARLESDLQFVPDRLSVYVAYQDRRPVAAAWIDFQPGSQFAGLWGGTTAPEFRRRGFYRALLGARVQEARERGRRFLLIDAGPMSRPIVEKHGFQWLTMTQGFVRDPRAKAPSSKFKA